MQVCLYVKKVIRYLATSTSVDSVLGHLKGLSEQCRKGQKAKVLTKFITK